ncbi:MAG: outer membrane protein assembly factor BamD [Saprospiraceae bacterium]|nr:outer membrane protein assembly factor BamD [Saprospiraceae bacterium]MDZ4705733.1 outer membrane protein assembly factor BamD [Saprospiraceae bacterium]
MKIRQLIWSLLAITLLASCKSEFERVRASGDPNLLYTKAFEYYDNVEYLKAQALLELVMPSYRGKKEAEDIFMRYAFTYYHTGQYILASYYFNNFSQTYSTSPQREEADYMSAFSNYKLSPTFRLDQSYSEKAIEGFQLFINTYPQSKRVAECNALIDVMRKKMEVKAFEEGKLYFDLRQYQASMQSFENLLKDFPETDAVEDVRYMMVKAAYLLAENSIVDKQEERFRDAVTRATEFRQRFASSKYRKEILEIEIISNKKIKQLTNVGYQNQSSRTGS